MEKAKANSVSLQNAEKDRSDLHSSLLHTPSVAKRYYVHHTHQQSAFRTALIDQTCFPGSSFPDAESDLTKDPTGTEASSVSITETTVTGREPRQRAMQSPVHLDSVSFQANDDIVQPDNSSPDPLEVDGIIPGPSVSTLDDADNPQASDNNLSSESSQGLPTNRNGSRKNSKASRSSKTTSSKGKWIIRLYYNIGIDTVYCICMK